MWDLIVSVPDHCLSFYFVPNTRPKFLYILKGRCVLVLKLKSCIIYFKLNCDNK